MLEITPALIIPLYKKHNKRACVGAMLSADGERCCPMGIVALDEGLNPNHDDTYIVFRKKFGYELGPSDFYYGFDYSWKENEEPTASQVNPAVFEMGKKCRAALIEEGLLIV